MYKSLYKYKIHWHIWTYCGYFYFHGAADSSQFNYKNRHHCFITNTHKTYFHFKWI